MKTTQVLLISLALLAAFVNCEDDASVSHIKDDGGYHVVKTPANGDANSCQLSLSVTVTRTSLDFAAVQFVGADGGCTHQDLQFAPIFRNIAAVSGSVVLTPTADHPNLLKGSLTKAQFDEQNGKACLNLGQYNGLTWLKCRFRYASIFITVDWYQRANGNFARDWTGILYPMAVQTVGTEVVSANSSYQDIVGMTYENCQQWDSVINDVNSNISLWGTQYQSNNYDLSIDLSGLKVYAIVVRNGAGAYKSWQPNKSYAPFAAAAQCHNLGVSYATVLQGLDCTGGCNLSVLLYDQNTPGKAFVLTNQGFSVAAARRLRA